MVDDTIREQLRRNAVALISLVIAITSLGYNTWRNEHTEFNRNQRQAAFDVLRKLAELQELAFLNHYDCNFSIRGNVRSGWVLLQTVEDLAMVLEELPPAGVGHLREVWAGGWQDLYYEDTEACTQRSAKRRARGEEAALAVRDAVTRVREDALEVLRSLK